MHSAVWESTDAMGSLGLVATWSRLMVTTDPNNEDKPIMANRAFCIRIVFVVLPMLSQS
jgi:hypothetical protein